MYLEELLSWIKLQFPSFTTYIAGASMPEGKDALGVYVLAQKEAEKKHALGGIYQTSYAESRVRLVVQLEEACAAQKKAMQLYQELEKDTIRYIADHKIQTIQVLCQEPQPHIGDERGLQYDIDFLITYER